MKKLICLLAVMLCLTTFAFAGPIKALTLHNVKVSEENIVEINKMEFKEREYLINKLGKIRKGMSRDEVVKLLGPPSRDLPQKVNWWVHPDKKDIRAGVYFWNNRATDVVLDGGTGSFYYRQKL